MNISYWPFMIYLPIWFHAGLGYSDIEAGVALLAYTLPTLFMPPLGERFSLRCGPQIAIPAGLFTIGFGFMLMKLGSSASQPNWLTMLPGCLIAGAGLGMTNTPVTNTTTGSVSSDRAGMASGIDMSARMISLALNIALMGFILISGVIAQLKRELPNLGAASLWPLAEQIASGRRTSSPEIPASMAREALTNGFGHVMLYGGAGVWILAVISYAIFRAGSAPLLKPASAE